VLSLVGLAHGLVADLAVTISIDWLVGSVVHGSDGSSNGGSNDWGVDGVGNNWSMGGVGNNWSVDSMGNNWSMDGMSNNWSGGVSRSWSHDSGLVGRGGLVGGLLRVRSCALVGHISDESIVAVGGVGDLLDPAVGESHSVGSLDIAGTIGGFLSIEVRLGVVVSNSVGVGVGGNLIGVLLGLVGGSGLVSNGSWGISWGSVDSVSHNWGSVSYNGGSMDSVSYNWSVVNGMVDWGMDSVVDWGDGVVGNDGSLAYWDWLVGSNGGLDLNQTLGVVSLGYGGVCGSESLALTESSDLTVGGGD